MSSKRCAGSEPKADKLQWAANDAGMQPRQRREYVGTRVFTQAGVTVLQAIDEVTF